MGPWWPASPPWIGKNPLAVTPIETPALARCPCSYEPPLVAPGRTFGKWGSGLVREGEQNADVRIAIRFRDTAGPHLAA